MKDTMDIVAAPMTMLPSEELYAVTLGSAMDGNAAVMSPTTNTWRAWALQAASLKRESDTHTHTCTHAHTRRQSGRGGRVRGKIDGSNSKERDQDGKLGT